jgi:demethylmenaquinone methyltransferase/2-methoxy-6-polyprenyl-1,4-benzoquinol methylase
VTAGADPQAAGGGGGGGPTTDIVPGSGAMFDRIAGRYDLLNRLLSFGSDGRWRRRTAAALALPDAPATVLDLATGTADLAIDIARRWPKADVIGIDPSLQMLGIGRLKVAARGLDRRIELRAGDALGLALDDASVDGVTVAFGLRNFPDRPRGLREMARVVKPGGRVCVLELAEPRGVLGPLARLHVHRIAPRLGALLSGAREYRYLARSIAAFPPPDEVAAMMADAGLDAVEIKPLMFGACTLFVAERRRPS